MTPSLIGRWQTRLLMLATLGLLISAIFAAAYGSTVFLVILGYVAVLGIGWDVVYTALQSLRWDRDWPPAFQVAAGIVEGAFLYWLIKVVALPGIDADAVSAGLFTTQYGLVWLTIFIWTQGPMRALFPFWRFHGGQLWPRVPSGERR